MDDAVLRTRKVRKEFGEGERAPARLPRDRIGFAGAAA
jgi:hypothetical protein